MTAPIFSNNGDFATRIESAVHRDLMTLQADSGMPESESTLVVSDPILPDRHLTDRLGHMDPELYDLDEHSHLIRLLSALMGGAGAGGLRKQIAIQRLQNSFRTMHFLDLDRFYGALFGVKRTRAELMPDFGTLDRPAQFNPYTDAAGSDAWDDLHSRDASYRDRLIKFARAIPLGGTYPGLRAAAEALLSVECEIYESWTWVDEQNASASQPPVLVYTWSSLTTTWPTWSDMANNHTWGQLTGGQTAGSYFLGRTGQKNRGEVVVQPKRQIRPDEQYEVQRVMQRLQPAGVQSTVNPEGVAIHQRVPVRAVAADSEYWEIIYKVTPNPVLVPPAPAKPVYPQPSPAVCQPRPAFSQYQGEKWSYNSDIIKIYTYKMWRRSLINSSCFASYVFPRDNYYREWKGSLAVLDPSLIQAARAGADGILTSLPSAQRADAATLRNAVSVTVGSR